MMTDNWYALHVRTGQEQTVVAEAKGLGVTALAPQQVVLERRNGEFQQFVRHLIPGYVFIQLPRLDAARYYDFKRLDGVVRFLGFSDGDIPRAIPPEEMDLLLQYGDTPIGISLGVRLSNGKIQIIDGPLKGLQGRIKRIDARQHKAIVILDLLGRTQTLSLALDIQTNTNNPDEPEAEQSPR